MSSNKWENFHEHIVRIREWAAAGTGGVFVFVFSPTPPPTPSDHGYLNQQLTGKETHRSALHPGLWFIISLDKKMHIIRFHLNNAPIDIRCESQISAKSVQDQCDQMSEPNVRATQWWRSNQAGLPPQIHHKPPQGAFLSAFGFGTWNLSNK